MKWVAVAHVLRFDKIGCWLNFSRVGSLVSVKCMNIGICASWDDCPLGYRDSVGARWKVGSVPRLERAMGSAQWTHSHFRPRTSPQRPSLTYVYLQRSTSRYLEDALVRRHQFCLFENVGPDLHELPSKFIFRDIHPLL